MIPQIHQTEEVPTERGFKWGYLLGLSSIITLVLLSIYFLNDKTISKQREVIVEEFEAIKSYSSLDPSISTSGNTLQHTYNSAQAQITSSGQVAGLGYDITPFLQWWATNISKNSHKWGVNLSIPNSPLGIALASGLERIVFNITLTNATVYEVGTRNPYGFSYRSGCTFSSAIENCNYVDFDFEDIKTALESDFGVVVPYSAEQTSSNSVSLVFDIDGIIFSPGQVLSLDPTITITNVNTYISEKTNITTEAAPLAHITTLDESLLLYMPFDYRNYALEGGSDITEYDYTPYNIDGTLTAGGRTTWNSSGIIGGAYFFDGIDDNTGGISLGTNDLLNFSRNSFTISAWTRNVDSATTRRTIFARGSPGGANIAQYGLEIFSGNYRFLINNGSASQVSSSTGTLNEWTHVAATWNGSTTRLYVNGTLMDSDVMSAGFYDNGLNPNFENAATGIGADFRNTRNYWNGTLDEVMVFNRSLSAAQIAEIFNNQTVRFKGPEASQLFSGANISQDGTLNRINITVNTTQHLGSSMQLRLRSANASNDPIENTTWQTIPDGATKTLTFNISTTVFNVSLEFNYSHSLFKFYSPMLTDGIDITSWVDSAIPPASLNPNVTNLVEPTDPSTYVKNAQYQFNATVRDDGVLDAVLFEFNNINYTAHNLTASVYNVTLVDLGVGVYTYRWFANDTQGNMNNTEGGTFTVSKAAGSVFTYLNGSRSNKNYVNNTAFGINTTGILQSGDPVYNLTMYVNNTWWAQSISANLHDISNFTTPGVYNINVTLQPTQNFTYDDERWVLTISVPSTPSNATTTATPSCKYKKFGYWNPSLPWFREVNCI